MYGVVRHVGLVVFGVLLACLGLEVALRSTDALPEVTNPLEHFHESDPDLGWRGKPNVRLRYHRSGFDTVVEHDANGWRRPQPSPPPDAPRRVLVLGDSFTWGWGVDQGQVFTDLLQARLAPRVAVYNRGVNGFGTAQEYLLLERELAEAHYDVVLVMFFLNDVEDDTDPKEGRRPYFTLDGDRLVLHNRPAAPLMNPLQRFLKDHSRAYQLLDFELTMLSAG